MASFHAALCSSLELKINCGYLNKYAFQHFWEFYTFPGKCKTRQCILTVLGVQKMNTDKLVVEKNDVLGSYL